MEEKPRTIEEYRSWLKKAHGVIIDARYSNYYEDVARKAREDFEKSGFWGQLLKNLDEYDQEYQVRTGYPLFVPNFKPEVLSKPFDSFLIKSYRKNVLENDAWPKEPHEGWIFPTNWFSLINDIVRTLLMVKYLDGAIFIKDKIGALCKENRMHFETSYEAREEGYYALHIYTKKTFEIPKIDWETENVDFWIEIQITTQLQEVIRRLLHKYYERKRKMTTKPAEKWQWDYKCEEFSANYLGHILHYVEGMIVEIRERQKATTA